MGEGIQVYLMSDHSGQQIVITDHYLVVAKIRKRIAENKQGSHKPYLMNNAQNY
jgi:hypothetical protein